jgi:mannitol/fructose-specific phosphotransferase system IIA component (Ntr-type)
MPLRGCPAKAKSAFHGGHFALFSSAAIATVTDPRPGLLAGRMTLGNLLSVDQIIPEMKAAERWSAIVELVDLLVDRGQIKVPDREVVLAALRQREETMSTGIGFGIAIPHASSDRVGQVVAAFGRSTQGIEFDSLDNAPVRFIVLFVVPKDQFQTHLRTLAAIAKFLNDRSVRERLGSATSTEEILAIFENTAGSKA